jgi:uncharacterized protein YqgV (UPF0045/DUF77 family)
VKIRAEFTVEPFRAGAPGPHVAAAVDGARRSGLEPEVGPFGTAVEGDLAEVVAAVANVVADGMAAGATSVSLHVSAPGPVGHPLVEAVAPVVAALGAQLVPADRVEPGDVALRWEGEVVGGVRLPDLQGALARLIAQVEHELGAALPDLSRTDKQRAARLLQERGAFLLRNAAEEVADAMGVSRVTLYSYLNAVARS